LHFPGHFFQNLFYLSFVSIAQSYLTGTCSRAEAHSKIACQGRRKKTAAEIKKHNLVLRRVFSVERSLESGRVAAKEHPTEGAVLDRSPVAHEIGGFMWQACVDEFMWKAYAETQASRRD
jgi:hypothetical protein